MLSLIKFTKIAGKEGEMDEQISTMCKQLTTSGNGPKNHLNFAVKSMIEAAETINKLVKSSQVLDTLIKLNIIKKKTSRRSIFATTSRKRKPSKAKPEEEHTLDVEGSIGEIIMFSVNIY
jgi:hypothetical protein